MDNAFQSIETYYEWKPDGINPLWIKKLTLGETLEWTVLYPLYILEGQAEVLRELLRLSLQNLECVDAESLIQEGRAMEYLQTVVRFNRIESGKRDGAPTDPQWLQRLIAFFGLKMGWTKHEVLSLYPDEAESLIREIRLMEREALITQLALYHKPEWLQKRLESEALALVWESQSERISRMRELESEWLSKTYPKNQ